MNQSESTKKRWLNPEWRANQVAKRVGKKHSVETKLKMSLTRTGKKLPPFSKEHRIKVEAENLSPYFNSLILQQ